VIEGVKERQAQPEITEVSGFHRLFNRQKKQHTQSPDAENQSANTPRNSSPAAVGRNHRTKNRVEAVNQCEGAVKRDRFDIGLNKEKTGEIAEEMIQVHQ
jgi:hypothetical protein